MHPARATASLLSRIPLLLGLTSLAGAGTIYVDADLKSGANDGSSWKDALRGSKGLRTAADQAVPGDRIFVRSGVYVPTKAMGHGSLSLASGVEIYGSFRGGETSPAERPLRDAAPSVLTGDLEGDDDQGLLSDNSYHVVRAIGVDPSAVLDGFVVTGGNAVAYGSDDSGAGLYCLGGTGPTIRNCRFVGNFCNEFGAAAFLDGSSATFVDCIFEQNHALSFGGAIDVTQNGAVHLERCVLRDNQGTRGGAVCAVGGSTAILSACEVRANVAVSSAGGGAVWLGPGATGHLDGCTLFGNRCIAGAEGGVKLEGATVDVVNSILWGNVGIGGAHGSANQISGGAAVSYSIVEGGFAGAGNLASDPLFVDSATGDLRLASGSPAIDAGDNAGVPLDALFDLALRPRRADDPAVADTGSGTAPLADMGAHEHTLGVGDAWCLPLPNSSGAPAILTASGSLVLQDDDVSFDVRALPGGVFGYFVMSDTRASLPVGGGRLCLGGHPVRFDHDVLQSGATGTVTFSPDLTALPHGTVFQAGETWGFQLWYRDGLTSNLSSSLALRWE